MKKHSQKFFKFIIIIIILICIPATSAHAEEPVFFETAPIVKVGVSDFPFFFMQEEDGTYTGLLCDYLSEIAKYTGWKIEYVIDSPSILLDKMLAGEINLMGTMNKTDQTLTLFDFAELPSGYAYSVLAAKSDNVSYIMGDYDSFTEDMKVGIYTKAADRMAAFEQFRITNGITVTPVYYDDLSKWENCLNKGEVDAILTNSAKIQADEKILVNFKKENYYFATTKGASDILRELNIALEKIELINPQFASSVYQKYTNKTGKNTIPLTNEELDYIKEHPVLKVVTAPDWKPISYYNKANNEYSGITVDILKQISSITGLQFEYINANSFEECLDILNSGKADFLAGICDTRFLDNKQNIDVSLSIPYLPTQTLILHRKGVSLEKLDDMGNVSLGMPFGFDYKHNFKNCTLIYYDTIDDCIEAVKNGAVDFSAISNLAVEQYIRSKGSGNLIFVPVPSSTMELSIAFVNPANPILLSIVDKAIYSIDESTKQSIIFKNTSLGTNKLTFLSFIYSNPAQAIFILAAASLLLFSLLFLIMQMRLKLSRNIALNAEAYRIIEELSDEYLFEYDFTSDEMMLPEKFAKLIGCHKVIRLNGKNDKGIELLFSSFEKHKTETNFTIEFMCSLITGRSELFRAVCIVQCGASGKAVRGIGKIINIQADFEEKQQLHKKADTDFLTSLYNKRYCEELISERLVHSSDLKNASILLIDLDHFKDVNDTLGHLGGDEALIHFSAVLKETFQEQEIIGRWGGDEFFVFIQNVPSEEYLTEKTKRLCIGMDTYFSYGDITHKLSISVGVAFTTTHFDYQTLFQAADVALYTVKNSTRNGYHIVDC